MTNTKYLPISLGLKNNCITNLMSIELYIAFYIFSDRFIEDEKRYRWLMYIESGETLCTFTYSMTCACARLDRG